jgi:hypothetical protein
VAATDLCIGLRGYSSQRKKAQITLFKYVHSFWLPFTYFKFDSKFFRHYKYTSYEHSQYFIGFLRHMFQGDLLGAHIRPKDNDDKDHPPISPLLGSDRRKGWL